MVLKFPPGSRVRRRAGRRPVMTAGCAGDCSFMRWGQFLHGLVLFGFFFRMQAPAAGGEATDEPEGGQCQEDTGHEPSCLFHSALLI
jgi:hypothetical protein